MYERVFLDTNPLIYLVEKRLPYAFAVRNFLSREIHEGEEFYTSTITDTEFLVLPYRERDFEAVSAYSELLSSLNVLKCFVTDAIADRATGTQAFPTSFALQNSLNN